MVGFLLQRHGVGARGGGHAPEAHRAAGDGEFVVSAHCGYGYAVGLGEGREALLACAHDVAAQRYPLQQGCDVGLLHYQQVLVRGVAAEAPHGGGGVVYGYAALAEQGLDVSLPEGLVCVVHQPLAVAVEHCAEDEPHLVRAVGVEEVHAPASARRREAAEHQQPRLRRQEGLEGGAFYRGACPPLPYLFCGLFVPQS